MSEYEEYAEPMPPPMCPVHRIQMRRGQWGDHCTRTLADGSYCRWVAKGGRVYEKKPPGSNPAPHKPTARTSGPSVAVAPDPYKNRRAALAAAALGFRDIQGVTDAAAKYEAWLDRPFPAKAAPEVVPLPQEDIEFDPGNL